MDYNYEWHYLGPSPEEAQMGPVDLTTMTSLYLRGDIVSIISFPSLTREGLTRSPSTTSFLILKA